jgi:predicted secreted protein
MEDDASPASFKTICGLKTSSFAMSNNDVDTTIPNCDDPSATPEKTSVPGIADRTFQGSGKFVSSTAGKAAADVARLGQIKAFQVIVPGYGTFEGQMFFTEFQWSGEMEGTLDVSLTLKPSEALAFTPES